MSKVSILIAARGEQYKINSGVSVLYRTIQDIYEKATGDFETIVVFDGPPYQDLPEYPNLTVLKNEWSGTKESINIAARIATGKYLFKIDAHCMLDQGFDEVLQSKIEDNWVVTPRLYILNAEEWKWQDNRFHDYFYLPCPLTDSQGFRFQAGAHWKGRTQERLNITDMDENMKLHGSAWFMSKDFYWNCLNGLNPNDGAGRWNGEDIEISLKTWLGPWGGKLMVNKNTWYAHMHRGGQRPREFGVSHQETSQSATWSARYWMKNSWKEQTHELGWLIEKFWPVATWPENWRVLWKEWDQNNIL